MIQADSEPTDVWKKVDDELRETTNCSAIPFVVSLNSSYPFPRSWRDSVPAFYHITERQT